MTTQATSSDCYVDFDRDTFHDFVASHGYGSPSEEGFTLGQVLMDDGNDYATAACEVAFRGLTQQKIVDYSIAFPDALIAQGSGGSFLALYRRDSPTTRADGKKAHYELDYRWLSQECEEENDQSWACVQGAEVTYWQRKEIESLIRKVDRQCANVNLFDHFLQL